MEVSCPACNTRYLVADEKVRGKTARMRCKSCQTVWMVTGPVNAAASFSATGGRAAVVRRGTEREKRDLFATPAPDHAAYRPETVRPPAPNYGFSTAERNENSVLFTVDALKRAAGARVQTPEPVAVAPSTPQDDEGVIDLKALSQAPPPPAGPLVPPTLFSEPPPAAFAVDASGPAQAQKASNKWIAWTAAAAAAIVLLGVGVAALAFRAEEPVNRLAAAPPPVTAAAPAPSAPPAVTAATAPKADEATPPTTGDDEKVASKGKGKGKGKGKATAARGRGRATTTKAKASAPAAAPKASDPCHCKGDFTCILRCTAKGK